MSKFIYGATINGIQKYIFGAKKLSQMTGASEIVEKFCTTELTDFIKEQNLSDVVIIVQAAGNIRLRSTEETIQVFVKYYKKNIMAKYPGLEVSQAVVELSSEQASRSEINNLEEKLKTQRNIPEVPQHYALTAFKRAPLSGLAAVESKGADLFDSIASSKDACHANNALIKKIKNDAQIKNFPFDFEDMLASRNKSWLAVIHADGNSLGQLIQTKFKGENSENEFKEFSKNLDQATQAAAQEAFILSGASEPNQNDKFPVRPIIIGGDDLTIVCRADLAIPFAKHFLLAFKAKSKEIIGSELTACAGIAYFKKSYPFHYAYELAEELCSYAKKGSKAIDSENVLSSLAFHKIQSSFVEDYEEIAKKELKAGEYHFRFGPYAVTESTKMPQLDALFEARDLLQTKSEFKSGYRRWLTECSNNSSSAEQLLSRFNQIAEDTNKDSKNKLDKILKNIHSDLSFAKPYCETTKKSPLFDLLALISIDEES